MPFLTWILGLSLGGALGYTIAEADLANKCQRLGAFYVAEKTYECMEKK